MYLRLGDIDIEVIRKNIKHMHLSVLPPNGIVRVSAPFHLNNKLIKMFVSSKLNWIRKQQDRFKDQPRQTRREYVNGESIYLWGIRYLLNIEYSKKAYNIKIKGDRLVFTVRQNSTIEQKARYINEWYRNILKNEIPKYLDKWQQITGLYCNNWKIKNMKTKWGTCNAKDKRIWLNLQLAKKPVDCLEYVIVHELLHLKINNHGKEFKALLNKYYPNWQSIKKDLNDRILDYYE